METAQKKIEVDLQDELDVKLTIEQAMYLIDMLPKKDPAGLSRRSIRRLMDILEDELTRYGDEQTAKQEGKKNEEAAT